MSGRVRDAFAARGWEAWSADLLPSENPPRWTVLPDGSCSEWEDYPGFHYQGDVRDLFDRTHPVNRDRSAEMRAGDPWLWHLCIMHPPCDHLSYAGARWFKAKQADGRQQTGARFFMQMVNAPSPLVAVENPHSIMQKLYRPPTQTVQPWMFGEPMHKRIDLWLKGLPLLEPTSVVEPTGRVTTGGGNWRTDQAAGRLATSRHEDGEGRARRAIVRSRTAEGLAEAMAEQWGSFAE